MISVDNFIDASVRLADWEQYGDVGYIPELDCLGLGNMDGVTKSEGYVRQPLRDIPRYGAYISVSWKAQLLLGNPRVGFKVETAISSSGTLVWSPLYQGEFPINAGTTDAGNFVPMNYDFQLNVTTPIAIQFYINDDFGTSGAYAVKNCSVVEKFTYNGTTAPDSFLITAISGIYKPTKSPSTLVSSGTSYVATFFNTLLSASFGAYSEADNIASNGDFEEYNGIPDPGTDVVIPDWTTDIINNTGYVEPSKTVPDPLDSLNYAFNSRVSVHLAKNTSTGTSHVRICQIFANIYDIYGLRIIYSGDAKVTIKDNNNLYYNFTTGSWSAVISSYTANIGATWANLLRTFVLDDAAASATIYLEAYKTDADTAADCYFDLCLLVHKPPVSAIGLPTTTIRTYEVLYVINDSTIALKEDYDISGGYSSIYLPGSK